MRRRMGLTHKLEAEERTLSLLDLLRAGEEKERERKPYVSVAQFYSELERRGLSEDDVLFVICAKRRKIGYGREGYRYFVAETLEEGKAKTKRLESNGYLIGNISVYRRNWERKSLDFLFEILKKY